MLLADLLSMQVLANSFRRNHNNWGITQDTSRQISSPPRSMTKMVQESPNWRKDPLRRTQLLIRTTNPEVVEEEVADTLDAGGTQISVEILVAAKAQAKAALEVAAAEIEAMTAVGGRDQEAVQRLPERIQAVGAVTDRGNLLVVVAREIMHQGRTSPQEAQPQANPPILLQAEVESQATTVEENLPILRVVAAQAQMEAREAVGDLDAGINSFGARRMKEEVWRRKARHTATNRFM
mmetsp:Transcript_23466/g.32044  ORF Transcript_23466/g.32044 Transcript_23466/m.32044 type:complete len:237 (-) Transcript_23466:297-1007(-)